MLVSESKVEIVLLTLDSKKSSLSFNLRFFTSALASSSSVTESGVDAERSSACDFEEGPEAFGVSPVVGDATSGSTLRRSLGQATACGETYS